MKFLSVLVAGSFLTVASAGTIGESTLGSIMSDLNKISHLYAKTVAAIAVFPQSGTQGAAVIHDHETSIETLFGKVINNLEVSKGPSVDKLELIILPAPVPDKNARKIIKSYQSFTPTIIESLNAINAKASEFGAMGAAPMLSLSLDSAIKPCAQFASLIMAMTPADMTDDVNKMFDQLTAARDDASAALASVMTS